MKLTKQKLKQMILESMYTPSTLIDDAIADPDVDPRIKDLLSSDREDDKRNGLQLLSTLYPDKYGTGKIEDKLQMARQAYDQAVEAGFGDSFTRASTDHVKLGSPEYARTFKDASNHRSYTLKNIMDEFFSASRFPIRRLRSHYDPRFGGIFTVYSRSNRKEDLKQIQAFRQYLAMQGRSSDPIENDKYKYFLTVRL